MGNSLRSLWQLVQTANSKRTLGVLALLIVVAAIPLTVIVSQKQQEIRQRACEGDREYNECTGCQTSRRVAYVCGQYSVVVGSQYDAGCTGGCSSTCNPDRQYNECTGCNTSKRISNNECNNTYTVVIPSQNDATCTSGCPSAPPEPDCNDQQCTYIQDVGTAECPSGKKTVIGRQKSGGPCHYLGSCSVTSCVSLITPSNSPTPSASPSPTNTPVPIPGTATPTPSVTYLAEDVNRSGCVDIFDFNILLSAIRRGSAQTGTYPDINNNGTIDIFDFNLWLSAFRAGRGRCQ